MFQRSADGAPEDELTQLIPPLLAMMEDKLGRSGHLNSTKDNTVEEDCYTRLTCEANRPGAEFGLSKEECNEASPILQRESK